MTETAGRRRRFRARFPELDERTRAESLQATLAAAPSGRDIWLFGYGSLMWRPGFEHLERRQARLFGWHRRFCVWTAVARGSLDRPGLGLGLDHGGSCRGMAFRLAGDTAAQQLVSVWRREMLTGIYEPRWAPLHLGDHTAQGVAFVVRRAHPQYAGQMPPATSAGYIAAAVGENGSCLEYLANTLAELRALGIRDRALERLRELAEGSATR